MECRRWPSAPARVSEGLSSEAYEYGGAVSGNGQLDAALVIGGDGGVEVERAERDLAPLAANFNLQRLGGQNVIATFKPLAALQHEHRRRLPPGGRAFFGFRHFD